MNTKHRLVFGLGLLILIALGVFLFRRDPIPPPPAPTPNPETKVATPRNSPPIGDQFLENYADPSTSAREDLEKVGRAVESMLLLFKNLDTRHIATNIQLSAFLRGENPEKTPHISPESPIFGPSGEIIDRWGTPIFVHPLGTGLIELRSAGPDRVHFTEDDLIRGF